MPIERFIDAKSADDAVRRRTEAGTGARYVAGGTDLLCEPEPPRAVINVKTLGRGIRRDGNEVVIGAGTTITDLLLSDELAEADGGLLRAAARDFASWQIRNMATVGGNLASAVPSADLAPPLLVLDAVVVALGAGGRREIPLGEFFRAPHVSALGDDLLVEARFPAIGADARVAWAKSGRVDGDIAVVNAAVFLRVNGGAIDEARIAAGAVAPTPVRAGEAERFLEGKRGTPEELAKAGDLARGATNPIDDQRASADYRRHLVGVLVRRALEAALGGKGEA